MELHDEANLEVTALEDFAVLTVPLLKAFILAHDDKVKLVKDVPRKGNVKEVREHGVHNTISQVFECRMKPNLLVGSYPHTQAALVSAQANGDGTNREGSSRNMTIV